MPYMPLFGLDSTLNSGTLGPLKSVIATIMGQQLNKVIKRRRRKKYLERKKALAKAGISHKSRSARAEAKSAKKPAVKKPAAKKAPAKPKAEAAATAEVVTNAQE